MTCTCANADTALPARDPAPARLFVLSDDARLWQQLRLLGHVVFPWRPAVHESPPSESVRARFGADAVVTDRDGVTAWGLPVIRVALPTACTECLDHAYQPAVMQHLADALAGIAQRTAHPSARTVMISGYYGAKNTGDNLLLEALAQALTADPSVDVVVAATNPAEVERSHGLPAFSRKDLAGIAPEIDACDAFVLGGGGLWNDYNYNELGGTLVLFDAPKSSVPGWTQTQLLARILGADVHAYGLGVGPLTDSGARELVRFAARNTDSLVVRDTDSQQLLAGLGIVADVAPDPVYGMEIPRPGAAPIDGRYIAVNLREWKFGDETHRAALLDALTQWCREHALAVVGVPMQPSDVKELQSFLEQLPTDVQRLTLRWQHDPSSMLGALAHAELVVSMRLHTCLLAHRLHRPTIGLCYDPKVRLHFTELGRDACALDLDASSAAIAGALQSALDGLPAQTIERIAAAEQDAAAGLRALAARVAAAPVKRIPQDRRFPAPPAPPAEPKGFLARMRG